MQDNNKRINWIDMAKGIGMLLVIIGHVGAGHYERWIYSFHLPLFFFLSGYVFSVKSSFKEFIIKKIKGILVPYFCLGALLIVYQAIHEELESIRDLNFSTIYNEIIDLVVQVRCWDLWYLTCLFMVNVIFYVIIKLLKRTWAAGAASVLLTIFGFYYYMHGGKGIFWNIDVCFFAVFFFFVGYWFKNGYGKKLLDKCDESRLVSILVFIIAWIVNFVCGELSYDLSEMQFEMYMGTYGVPYLSYAAAVGGIIGTVVLSKWISLFPIIYIGRNSILYFAWHQSVVMPFTEVILEKYEYLPNEYTGQFESLGCRVFQFVFILITLTIASEIINRTKLKVILGK